MAKVIIKGSIPDDTITTKFDNVPSSTLYKLGDYRVETNASFRRIIDYTNKLNTFSKEYTLENIGLNKTISEKLYNNKITLNNDFSNISNYSYYGSLEIRFQYTLTNIIDTYPYSLYVSNDINGSIFNTALNIQYNSQTDTTSFDIPSAIIGNIGNLIIDSGNFNNNIKNININKTSYALRLDENTSKEYNVINLVGNQKIDTYVNFSVNGRPFNSSTASKSFHIKPNENTYFEFINNLSELEKYFLSNKKSNYYLIKLKKPISDENGTINLTDSSLEWSFSDGYNIDINGIVFEKFVKNLMGIAKLYEAYKTDTVYRLYTTESLKLFNTTSNNKIQILTRTYGETFDNIKVFIDGISKINTLGYDKYKSVPDVLIKNLAETLGWEYRDIVSEEDLLSNIFKFTQGDISTSKIPSEINIELWRRILNNTVQLFKSKGTRNSIITFFKMIGLPEEFIQLNEYIYLIDGSISNNVTINNSEDEIDSDLVNPIDENGFPIAPEETSNFYFQLSGNTDLGQTYINRYRDSGYDILRVNDNKKSWIYSNEFQNREGNNSYYDLNDSRYVINTKEISVGLSASNAELFKIYDDSNTTLSFGEYINKYLLTLIDVKNRKIISDNLGGAYPKLSKIYYDYLISNNEFKYLNLLNFIKRFDKYFVNFLKQLIPATTIYRGLGLIIENNKFIKQKHRYIRGINDGSEFVGNTEFLSCDLFEIISIDTTNETGNRLGNVIINVSGGNEPYEYSLNNIEYSGTNTFDNLESGNYNVYIRDVIGCTLTSTFNIEFDCSIIITDLFIEMNIPIIIEELPDPTPTIPILPTPTPIPPIVEKVCPLDLEETLWTGPYTSSNEACLLYPIDIINVDNFKYLYININSITNNTINYELVNTAWLNCNGNRARPAASGFYSNGIGWIYISNIISQTGTNVSGSGTCTLDNGAIV